MKKLVNHVDHVAWISRPENLDANVAELERLSGATLARSDSRMGITVCISWEAGLEVIAPTGEETPINKELREYLETRGEGVYAVIFGVADIEAHKRRLEALGLKVGPEVGGGPSASSGARVVVRERRVKQVMNSWFVLGDIDYADDVVSFADV
ncbi:MAG TPA: hypothetical protein VJM34_17330 [Novosphingobium sp.]|nr:hypothetical protein [Novosphingobium sp.]